MAGLGLDAQSPAVGGHAVADADEATAVAELGSADPVVGHPQEQPVPHLAHLEVEAGRVCVLGGVGDAFARDEVRRRLDVRWGTADP